MQTAALSLFDMAVFRHATESIQSASSTELLETRMFFHDLRHLAQAIVGPADTLEIALEDHNMDLAKGSLGRLKRSATCVIDFFTCLAPASSDTVQRDEQSDVAQVVEKVMD